MEQLLRDHKLKITDCRLAMGQLLLTYTKPMTVEMLRQELKQRFDLVTMYRTVEAFLAAGIVFKETIGRTDYYYLADHQHHHIVCRNCKAMECLPCDHKEIRVPRFRNITHQLVLTGVCNHCADSKNTK